MKILNIKSQSHVVMETTLTKKDFENAVAFDKKCNKLLDEKGNTLFALSVGTKSEVLEYSVTVICEKDKTLYATLTFEKPISDVEKAKLIATERKVKQVVNQMEKVLTEIKELSDEIVEVDFDTPVVEVETKEEK